MRKPYRNILGILLILIVGEIVCLGSNSYSFMLVVFLAIFYLSIETIFLYIEENGEKI